ncbi:hypothetical protein [Hymenobacter daeguensis]
MGKEISLFSGYDQSENRTTNYCLLILRMLYQENPRYLAEAISGIIPNQTGLQVGVHFRQQVSRGNSVPDGIITQPGFSIYIETKNSDWFYDAQLKDHLNALSQESASVKVLLALGKFEGDYKSRFAAIIAACATEHNNQVQFAATTFETFLAALRIQSLPPALISTVDDFQQYLNENNLLPNWKGYMDVVNCARESDRLIAAETYVCPAAGGSYSHQRCEYLGMYWEKGVWKIASVRGVVDVYPDGTSRVLWRNDEHLTDIDLEQLARQKFHQAYEDNIDWEARVFVLDKLYDTGLEKDTWGPLRGKQYLYIGDVAGETLAERAENLSKESWGDLQENS